MPLGCRLLAVGCWPLAVGCRLLAVGCWPLAVGCWPLAVGRWPLAVGRWPLAVGRWPVRAKSNGWQGFRRRLPLNGGRLSLARAGQNPRKARLTVKYLPFLGVSAAPELAHFRAAVWKLTSARVSVSFRPQHVTGMV
jgi:hypothetical protein